MHRNDRYSLEILPHKRPVAAIFALNVMIQCCYEMPNLRQTNAES